LRQQHIAARKDNMTSMNTGAFKRHTRWPHSNAAADYPMDRTMTSSGMLSTDELRRLVAAMVD
jgi:hypothetical protein